MKTLSTLEVLGTESVTVLLLPLKEYKMEREEGVCQVEKTLCITRAWQFRFLCF